MNKGLLGLVAVLLGVVIGEAMVLAAPLPFPRPYRETAAEMETARARAKAIASATFQYYSYKDEFPPSLKALTLPQPNGVGPFLKPAELIDPWGKPYHYDPIGRTNGGDAPDIWAVSPSGKVIGNWK
jgi:hypothetical protein